MKKNQKKKGRKSELTISLRNTPELEVEYEPNFVDIVDAVLEWMDEEGKIVDVTKAEINEEAVAYSIVFDCVFSVYEYGQNISYLSAAREAGEDIFE